eukprot:10411392-Ditylum_brightwellii.AAC.1
MADDNKKEECMNKGTIQEQIQAAGEQDNVHTTVKETKLRLDFNIGKDNTTFKAQEQLLWILHRIGLVDPTVYAKSHLHEDEWTSDKDLSTGEKFTEEFIVR